MTIQSQNHLSGPLELRLSGAFALSDGLGRALPLTSAKACGVLALLATAPDQRRARRWVADRLWSDKPQESADANLRVALNAIGKATTRAGGVVTADRKFLALNRNRIRIVDDGRAEFLEGMDIADPEWEDWLRAERSLRERPAAKAVPEGTRAEAAPTCHVSIGGDGLASSLHVARLVDGIMSRTLAERLGEPPTHEATPPESGLHLRLSPRRMGNGISLVMDLRRAETGLQLWQGSMDCPLSAIGEIGQTADLHALITEATEAAISGRIQSPGAEGHQALHRAARRMLTFDHDELRLAQAELEALLPEQEDGLLHAWRAFLWLLLLVERLEEPAHAAEQAELAIERALRLDPTNSFVLAIASTIHLRIVDAPEAAVELAARALRTNPANPFAVGAMADAAFLRGDKVEGLRLARLARTMADRTALAPIST